MTILWYCPRDRQHAAQLLNVRWCVIVIVLLTATSTRKSVYTCQRRRIKPTIRGDRNVSS